jgi:uncharacterized protein YndB with AHSA1/START domain
MKSEFVSNERLAVAHHWIAEHTSRGAMGRSSVCKPCAGETYRTLRLTCHYDARPQRVFDAWLDPPFAARWLFATASRPVAHVEIDPRVGHAFRFVDRDHDDTIEYRGVYTEIVPNRRLAFTLVLPRAEQTITHVTAVIAPLNGGARLSLVHEQVPKAKASHINNRWTGILYGLGVTLAFDENRGVDKSPREVYT